MCGPSLAGRSVAPGELTFVTDPVHLFPPYHVCTPEPLFDGAITEKHDVFFGFASLTRKRRFLRLAVLWALWLLYPAPPTFDSHVQALTAPLGKQIVTELICW